MDDLATSKLLGASDTDKVASMVANLLEEFVTLSERVAKLEGSTEAGELQDRINVIVDRVMSPLV
ncbi:MAG: hypothetical protein HN725_11970 [Alphaproteobacteria bacterium]|jgi:hypothetical protein|nr:hypothetical protein [Alphaproteobacteria bacterium]MBT4086835.1 hypothetical protein [Alphaproteobacteria bacterium]MBT4546592.1 hypothetical protein [Alphaproteobacteria bacterium]MBT7746000.1 hypothetical protein [Alphaproteobacteria bacterium]